MQAGLKILKKVSFFRNTSHFLYKSSKNSNFASDLFKAIEEYKAAEMEKQTIKKQYKSRYNGKNKKRPWQNYSEEISEEVKRRKANFNPEDRIKRKKTVILLGYCGANYYGMQRNPGQQTIEEDLFKAMLKCKWIDEEGFNQPQQIHFQRAARTDKGVSAARQICSVKLPEKLDLEAINSELPDVIRVFATRRVTKGFNSKDQCNARTYTYTMPTIALDAEANASEYASYRISKTNRERFEEILSMYEGTKNFHNFTSKKEFLDPSSKRYIMSFKTDEPFLSENGLEFITCRVKGQSFMLHQIRKMVGLALAIVRGNANKDVMDRVFEENRLDIPMAPGLGLVLDQVHYDRYNERYGNDGVHENLTWTEFEPEIEKFIKTYINPTIFEIEFKDKPMLNWIETLGYHTYDVRAIDDEKIKNISQKEILKTEHLDIHSKNHDFVPPEKELDGKIDEKFSLK
ncbi:pseudouridylate synthase 1 homolog [Condylostylus longicornis]|uniref:pseudouridylate synthase 1 homolog n=1 Tax=Condylostylus longicornis TaxID=2530218 RepID=UPI00244DD3E8|nr:pseudouridylate synthase 1 homolog [Condylostylus longicornis]